MRRLIDLNVLKDINRILKRALELKMEGKG
jgi:hypothetical protein